jgi:hypothetical protein
VGGNGNLDNSVNSFLGGGLSNTMNTNGDDSTLVGGRGNTTSSNYDFLGGGWANLIDTSSDQSTLGGGIGNSIRADNSFIGGGYHNTINPGASYGVIGGGQTNFISSNATNAVALGGSNSGPEKSYGVTIGGNYTDAHGIGWVCMAGMTGFTGGTNLGASQFCIIPYKIQTSGAVAVRLTTDGNAAGANNCGAFYANSSYAGTADVNALDASATTVNEAWIGWAFQFAEPSNAASSVINVGTKPTPFSNGTVTGSDIALTADTTNGCPNLSFTPPTGNTDQWNVTGVMRVTMTRK